MTQYYLLYIFALTLSQFNNLLFMKKLQLAAGTSLSSNSLYMVINGVVSALVPAVVLVATGQSFAFTPYSVILATTLVLLSAVDTVLRLKAYEAGQIAIVNIVATLGSIVLSCLWGVVVLHETISVLDGIAILIMLGAVLMVSRTGNAKPNKKLWASYVIISLATSFVNIFSKQHQVEKSFETVGTLSFSVWIGIVRTVIFGLIVCYLLAKGKKVTWHFPKAATGYAAVSSLISGTNYLLTLVTSVVLPIVITSPLGVGFGIVMSAFLPWVFYKEQLSKRQLLGIGMSLLGTMLFLVF